MQTTATCNWIMDDGMGNFLFVARVPETQLTGELRTFKKERKKAIISTRLLDI